MVIGFSEAEILNKTYLPLGTSATCTPEVCYWSWITIKMPKTSWFSYHICRPWYNDLQHMNAKPMKTLQLDYPMMQF